MRLQRRDLLTGSAAAVAFAGLARNVQAQTAPAEETYVNEVHGYGPLRTDQNRLLDLPEGFAYQVISQSGDTMDDGLFVPGQPDGMGCFDLGGGKVALVRNHELKGSSGLHRNLGPGGFHQERIGLLDPSKGYDTYKDGRALPGGTTTLIYDLETRRTLSEHLSLAGTSTNCCGGHTPWGSWLTCEETEETPGTADVNKPHGYVFEVPAAAGLVDPVPLKAMGRFDHEAVCVDPASGVVYLTEDKNDGLFYRFLPTTPGKLAEGGRLQAMAFRDQPGADTRNQDDAREWAVGDWREVVWIDLEDVESPNADLRMRGHAAGAALVARGEGIFWGDGELYMTATSGGPLRRGQILRHVPSPAGGRIQLFLESADERTMNMGDNITVAPWGHLIVCEDNYSRDIRNHLKGVTPDGKVYAVARNVFTGNSEFAGAVFSPDGQVLFVNIMYPGITFAIRGPWTSVRT